MTTIIYRVLSTYACRKLTRVHALCLRSEIDAEREILSLHTNTKSQRLRLLYSHWKIYSMLSVNNLTMILHCIALESETKPILIYSCIGVAFSRLLFIQNLYCKNIIAIFIICRTNYLSLLDCVFNSKAYNYDIKIDSFIVSIYISVTCVGL